MIRKALLLLAVLPTVALAQDDISGQYSAVRTIDGVQTYGILELQQKGNSLTGNYFGEALTGARNGNLIDFVARDKNGAGANVHLSLDNKGLRGVATQFDGTDHNTAYLPNIVIAMLAEPLSQGTPKRYEFVPTVYYRSYSSLNKAVLTIARGDTVHTTTVDAHGADAKSVVRSSGGNPETGPFYVEGVMPGDTVAIHIIKLRLNRDWAYSNENLVKDAVNPGLAAVMREVDTANTYWHLDRRNLTGTPEKPSSHMKSYATQLRPMLGCVGVAAPGASAPPASDSGVYGGNMDFNDVGEGSTVYLQARVPGALIYVGDAHAEMGDGELNSSGLETSMDVEFRVDVLPNRQTPQPRVETETQITALGYEGSLDEALKSATSNMHRWLVTDYGLTPSEAAQVIGTAARLRITEVADRNSGVAVSIDKDRLKTLTR